MGEVTRIQWCDHTFNPWEGCTKISPGCAHCYAETRNHRFGLDNWGKGKPRRRTSAANWRDPLKWNKEGEWFGSCVWCGYTGPNHDRIGRCGTCTRADLYEQHRPRVFCASLADWLDDEVPIAWLADLLKLIHDTPNLDWLLLTKRPENWRTRLAMVHATTGAGSDLSVMMFRWLTLHPTPPPNIWLGASVEDQQRADERIGELLKIPTRIRFLSVEPMLGTIEFKYAAFNGADSFGTMPGIHWVIFGGESGTGARPCDINWIRDGVRQCREAGVKAFVKQLGTKPSQTGKCVTGDAMLVPPHFTVKDKKGGDMSEWPEDLRVREFPMPS